MNDRTSNLRVSDDRLKEIIRYVETYERPPGHAMADVVLALQELSNRRAFGMVTEVEALRAENANLRDNITRILTQRSAVETFCEYPKEGK